MKALDSRRWWAAAVLALCALPAHSAAPLSSTQVEVLTVIDSLPSRAELVEAFAPDEPVRALIDLATNASGEASFGIQLRAIRALPELCSPDCAGSQSYAALHGMLQVANTGVVANLISADAEQRGRDAIRARATLEAFGALGVPDSGDLVLDFLDAARYPSRDVRFTAAHTAAALCRVGAEVSLDRMRTLHGQEPTAQVRIAINVAVAECDLLRGQ